MSFIPPVLIVAGSDSGGGAGIQADIKAVTCCGAFAATAITALTAQNTLGVQDVYPIPPAFIQRQMESVLTDIGAKSIKIGMLHSAPVIEAVIEGLEKWALQAPLVVDPVMIAKGGQALLDPEAIETLKSRLLPKATLLTPNIPEAEALTDLTIIDEASMDKAAQSLLKLPHPPQAVLLKGGHLSGDVVVDLLVTPEGAWRYSSLRIHTKHTHGTGCTLASAIAAYLAQDYGLPDAVEAARDYVQEAIRQAPGLGKGQGPLNHAWELILQKA